MGLKFVKSNKPIEISLKDFILESKFDCLKLGVTKSWLQHNFVEPDEVMSGETYESSPIWRYGNFELHFVGDVLWMIFSDYTDELIGGDRIKLDKWILSDSKQTKMEDWVVELNRNAVNYSVAHVPEFEQTKLILNEEDNGVILTFTGESGVLTNPGEYKLGAIQLWSKELAGT